MKGPGGVFLRGRLEERRDGVGRHLAGDVARAMATHAVRHNEERRTPAECRSCLRCAPAAARRRRGPPRRCSWAAPALRHPTHTLAAPRMASRTHLSTGLLTGPPGWAMVPPRTRLRHARAGVRAASGGTFAPQRDRHEANEHADDPERLRRADRARKAGDDGQDQREHGDEERPTPHAGPALPRVQRRFPDRRRGIDRAVFAPETARVAPHRQPAPRTEADYLLVHVAPRPRPVLPPSAK